MNNADLIVHPERFFALVNTRTGWLYKADSKSTQGPSLYKRRRNVEMELARLSRVGKDYYHIVTVEIKGVLL